MKKVAIMQPYLFPYIGYWQLLNAADEFVILDDVQYINRGWINRNRILVDGRDHLFTFSVVKAAQTQKINERFFSADFQAEKTKFLKTLRYAYAKAPFFAQGMELIARSLEFSAGNIAVNIGKNLAVIAEYLDISTKTSFASGIDCNKELKAQDYILAINDKLGSDVYINPSGGVELYEKAAFAQHNIELCFLKSDPISYKQFRDSFVANLSIIDVIMFNSCVEIKEMLGRYELI